MFRSFYWLMPFIAVVVALINHDLLYVLYFLISLGGYTEMIERDGKKVQHVSTFLMILEGIVTVAAIGFLLMYDAIVTPIVLGIVFFVYVRTCIKAEDRIMVAFAKRKAEILSERSEGFKDIEVDDPKGKKQNTQHAPNIPKKSFAGTRRFNEQHGYYDHHTTSVDDDRFTTRNNFREQSYYERTESSSDETSSNSSSSSNSDSSD